MTVLLKPRSWHTKVIRNSGKRAFNFPLTYSTVSCRQELAHIQTGFANEPLGTGINVYPLPSYCRVCGLCRPVSGPRIGKVNILYLCKQPSQEFGEELYGNTTFVINSYYTLGAFLSSIGKTNSEKIKKIVVYYARMSHERAGLLGDWLREAWASLKGSSVIQTMTGLQSLRVVSVVGAGKILPSTLPWQPGPRPALIWTDAAARNGGWAGMATDVWGDGTRHRHSLFPALDSFNKIKIGRIEIEIEIDDGWLTGVTGSTRSRLDQRLQLTNEMKEQHMQNIRERVIWKDPEDFDEEELKQAVIKWNSKR